ncbi:hypothetical protein [Streptomyces sp. NPDC005423]|uniref:hypothetical protein n=1 Tax=Streptomyces sp. NPDC005423 TaxID=3155343 RepID=UPI00339E8283
MRDFPAAITLNLEGPAHVHITATDEAFPADAGSVTPPAPCPDPVYNVFDPTGSDDWTGLGRRSGLVGVCAEEGVVASDPLVTFAGDDVDPWVAVAWECELPEQAETRARADRDAASRERFIRSSSAHEWAM